ncbi:toprim domain-containing protein, partial [Chitinophaga ginsengisoli]|uniref:toprim domain-containing protein n=1 Tax=Chitinophaga ginsengisoli TaxID=363837 RepID=UPI0011B2011F
QEYIQSRGLETARLEIGYNTGQFHHGRRRDDQLIAVCVEAGLLSPWGTNSNGGQGYRPFGKYCIVFALRNSKGEISGMYFRSTVNDEDQRHYYLKERSGLYPCYPKSDVQRLILTESVIDAATLLQCSEISKSYGILACYGTNGLIAEHEAAIKGLTNLQEIIFAFDGDEAGRKAVAKYATTFKDKLPHVLISTLQLSEGEDINSMGISHTAEIFPHLLNSRTDFFLSVESVEKQKAPSSEPVTAALPATSILDSSNPYKLSYSGDLAIYYVQGGVSKQLDSMKVTLVVERKDNSQKSRNKLDLYEDKQVEKLCREVGEKLGLRKDILEQDLYQLTDLLDQYRERDEQPAAGEEAKGYALSVGERSAAERF